MRLSHLLMAVVISAALPLAAQERSGEITGTATDPSGAVIPGVTVTLTHQENQRTVSVTTGNDGVYFARKLEPGRYLVKFTLTGFTEFEVPDVNLLLGKRLRVDATLKVGAQQQLVEVSGAAPLIDITGTTIAQNITAEEFDRLPKTRSFQSMALTSPSVTAGDIEGGYQVNGASGSENLFTIDGISTNSLVDGRSRQNAQFEYLQEVQVKTAGIEAEYGGALGGVISAITKSGGNAFHGELHYYLAGNRLNAGPVQRLLLDPRDEQTVSFVQDTKGKNDQHEIGGSLGGYLLKDRIFFFSNLSPRWMRRSNVYLFDSGESPMTLENKRLDMSAFNKVSLDLNRVRANLSWVYTPTRSSGTLPSYNYFGNMSTTSLRAASVLPNIGWSQPQSNYTADVTITLSNTSILSLRGGYFYDNYKDTGIPLKASVTYNTSAAALPFDIPANLRQPVGYYNTPRYDMNAHDLTTRAHLAVDFSKYARFGGSHDIKAGYGRQKTVNNVDVRYPGGGYILLFWDSAYRAPGATQSRRGQYGFYTVDDIGTYGSTGGTINSFYVQDKWTVLPRLTLSLGVRLENEAVPSFERAIQENAFTFGYGDKIAPRLGATYDVFGDGRLKVYGSYGRFFDWTKYDLARGTFGGDFWRRSYYALETLDVFNLGNGNYPGENIWPGGGFRDLRTTSFGKIDPDLKPMSTEQISAGFEYQLNPQMVLSGRYVRNNLIRTIEDLGVLVDGDEDYYYVNPGEGIAKTMLVSGGTDPFPTPKPKRTYDAMELTLTRRFSKGWFTSASYVFSRLYGNYSGLGSSDELSTPTGGTSSGTSQAPAGLVARPGSNGTRAWDLDEGLWDAHGNLGNYGRLATDRPHQFKFNGAYTHKFGDRHDTTIGGFFRALSGTPLSTYVTTINQLEVFVNGRGDMGRTPVLTQADLFLAHEYTVSEGKKIRIEFNAENLFNQKTSRHTFNYLNRGAGLGRDTTFIDLSHVDLSQGYDYRALIDATDDGLAGTAYDPRYGRTDLFNTGFAGRLGLKFMF